MNRFRFWLLKVLQLQFFISLISFPILIYWGLPISIASFLGNILFTPVLAFFLFISSLIFFLELIYIPNNIFVYLLDYITKLWMGLFALGTKNWLITFPKVPNCFLILIPFIALCVLQNKKTVNIVKSTILFLLILVFSGICFKFKNNFVGNSIEQIKIDNKKLTIINKNNKISIIDNGSISMSVNPNTFIEYSLIPYLNKNFGSSSIDIFCTIINGRVVKVIECLINRINVNKIYLFNRNNKSKFEFDNIIESLKKDKNNIKFLKSYNIEKITQEVYEETV